MYSEGLILFRDDRDEAVQILSRKEYVKLHNIQTELTACLFARFSLSVPKKNTWQRPWLYKIIYHLPLI